MIIHLIISKAMSKTMIIATIQRLTIKTIAMIIQHGLHKTVHRLAIKTAIMTIIKIVTTNRLPMSTVHIKTSWTRKMDY